MIKHFVCRLLITKSSFRLSSSLFIVSQWIPSRFPCFQFPRCGLPGTTTHHSDPGNPGTLVPSLCPHPSGDSNYVQTPSLHTFFLDALTCWGDLQGLAGGAVSAWHHLPSDLRTAGHALTWPSPALSCTLVVPDVDVLGLLSKPFALSLWPCLLLLWKMKQNNKAALSWGNTANSPSLSPFPSCLQQCVSVFLPCCPGSGFPPLQGLRSLCCASGPVLLNQWSLSWGSFVSQGTLGSVWRYFGCHAWGELLPSWHRPGVLLDILQGTGQPPHPRITPRVSSTEVKKAWFVSDILSDSGLPSLVIWFLCPCLFSLQPKGWQFSFWDTREIRTVPGSPQSVVYRGTGGNHWIRAGCWGWGHSSVYS